MTFTVHSTTALLNFAIAKHEADISARVEDLYKWLFQATRGGEHAAPDEVSARKWLHDEWQTLDSPLADEPVWEPLCPKGDIGRLNLRPFRSNGGRPAELLQAFVASSRSFSSNGEAFIDVWNELGARLKNRAVGTMTYDSWSDLDRSMKAQDYPAVHHSSSYRQAHDPAYRVLVLSEMERLRDGKV